MMTDMEILQLADQCGVMAVTKHEWDGKRFNHTDDYLDGDGAALVIFAKAIAQHEREACAALCFSIWNKWLDTPEKDRYKVLYDAEDCAAAIRARSNT